MADRHRMLLLVRFLLKRHFPITRSLILYTIALAALFYFTGNATGEMISTLLVATSFAYGLPPALFVFEHRASGNLEMITTLPLRPEVVAGSIAIDSALIVIPGALSFAAGTFAGLRAVGMEPPPIVLLLPGCWLLLWFLTWMFAAFSVAMRADTFMKVPVAAVAAMLVLTTVVPDPDPDRVLAVLTTPPGSLLFAALGTVLLVAGPYGLYRLTSRGIAGYQPETSTRRRGWLARLRLVRDRSH